MEPKSYGILACKKLQYFLEGNSKETKKCIEKEHQTKKIF